MNRPPLVSIVTPCYNGVEFIERCIESVLTQDYPHVEHIIQDGTSTDGTLEILKKYSRQVDWVSEPDSGESDGLNRAFQRCRGDIICVLNADDELLPHAASWAVENLAKYPDMAVVYGDQYNIDSDGRVLTETIGPDYNFEKNLCVETVIPAQAAFIRRSHFDEVGFYTDMTLVSCPDYEMWVRISLKYPMIHVPGFICRYRLHPDSKGQQVRTINEMILSKRKVMDRLLSDPATPDSIKSLKKRAFSGVEWWGAIVIAQNGAKIRGLMKLLYSIWLYHPKIRLLRLARLLKRLLVRLRNIITMSLIFIACMTIGLLVYTISSHIGDLATVTIYMTILVLSMSFLLYKGLRFIYRKKWVLYRIIRDFLIITAGGAVFGLLVLSVENRFGPVYIIFLNMFVLVSTIGFLFYKTLRFINRMKKRKRYQI